VRLESLRGLNESLKGVKGELDAVKGNLDELNAQRPPGPAATGVNIKSVISTVDFSQDDD
jgi:hypothetical protein